MYELKVVSHFAAAHQLREYRGKCEELHGHNWKVEAYVTGGELAENGLLVDFRVIKDAVEKALTELDHRFLNDTAYFSDINPSSENIARYVFESIAQDVNNENVRVSRVTAWESDSACATYIGP